MFAQPYINLNGTVPEELIRQQVKRRRALTAALEAHCEACPHGRDYRNVAEYKIAREDYDRTRIFLVNEIQKTESILETIIDSGWNMIQKEISNVNMG